MTILLNDLNTEQLKAVTSPLGKNIMVLAGAGSGKTKVLSTKIAWLKEEQHIPLERVLAITFTNKAANEMRERIFKYCNITNSKDIEFNIGTFHGIAHKFLRRYSNLFKVSPFFHIIDQEDSFNIVKKIVKDKLKDNPKGSDKKFQKRVFLFIGGHKEENIKPHQVTINPKDGDARFSLEVYKIYEQILERDNLLDFGGLLNKFYDGLLSDNRLCTLFRDMFDIIFVDEFQDTNNVQYSIIKILNNPNTSFFVVGDDDQSIYGFRGANYTNVQKYLDDFNARNNVIKLERNYRSTSNILDIANEIISNNTARLGKNLFTNKQPTSKVVVTSCFTDRDEALFVCDKIKDLLSRKLMEAKDIAILYRANYISRVFESALRNAGIKYKIYGGLSFYQRAEIKDFIAYLRLVSNPSSDLSFLRIINVPSRKIGDKTLEQLTHKAQEMSLPLFKSIEHLDDKIKKKFITFLSDIEELSILIEDDSLPLNELGKIILERTDYVSFYEDDNYDERKMNAQELINDMAEFEENLKISKQKEVSLKKKLSLFLSSVTLAGDKDNQEGAEIDRSNHVSLMTVHGSKGLEFGTVFLPALEEGIFPSGKDDIDIEEERRLMYVAVTRAKERLYMSYCSFRGYSAQSDGERVNSRFIDEISKNHYMTHEAGNLSRR